MSPVKSASDIELNGIPLQLYRAPGRRNGEDYAPAELEWGFGTVDAATRIQTQVVPRRWRDWSGGMGYAAQPGDPEQTGVYHYGRNVCTRYPFVVTPGGLVTAAPLPGVVTTAPTAAFELGGDTYFVCGRYAVRIPEGVGPAEVAFDFGPAFVGASAVIHRDALGRGRAYVGGLAGADPGRIWEFDGTAWTQSPAVTGLLLETVKWTAGGVSAERLLVTDSHQTFRYTATANADPLADADYSNPIAVCSDAYRIRSIARFPERVFPICDDGIRDVSADETGAVQVRNLTPYWAKQLSPSNGRYCLAARNHVYATFAGGLDRVDVTSLQRQDEPDWCDVGAYLSNESPIYGTGPLCLDRGWLAQLKYDEAVGEPHLMYGIDRRETGRSGVGPLAWHGSEATLERDESVGRGLEPRFLYTAAPGGDPRMWISCQAGTVPHLRWLSLPRAQTPLQDWLNGGPMRFAPEGELVNADEAWGAGSDQKILQWFTIQSRNLGGGALLELYANAEHGDWIGQGAARRSPRTRVTPRGAAATGHTIGTRVVLKSNATVPAILEELTAYAEVNADLAEQRRYPIVLARANKTRTPAIEYRIPEAIWRLITPLQSSGPVLLKDELGETLNVSVQPGIGGRTIEDDDGRGWTRIASLVLTVLSTAGGRILTYGVGEAWGRNYVYAGEALGGEVLTWGVGEGYSRGYQYGPEA